MTPKEPEGERGLEERRLVELSRKALPGPWIRKWESFDVHWIGGFGALRSQEDIDFAVACVNYVRSNVLRSTPPRTP